MERLYLLVMTLSLLGVSLGQESRCSENQGIGNLEVKKIPGKCYTFSPHHDLLLKEDCSGEENQKFVNCNSDQTVRPLGDKGLCLTFPDDESIQVSPCSQPGQSLETIGNDAGRPKRVPKLGNGGSWVNFNARGKRVASGRLQVQVTGLCLTPSQDGSQMTFEDCKEGSSQRFTFYENGQIVHEESGLCLHGGRIGASLQTCREHADDKWDKDEAHCEEGYCAVLSQATGLCVEGLYEDGPGGGGSSCLLT